MAHIRVQKLTRDENGTITGGTASIIDTKYVSGKKYHSKQSVRECLGKVIEFSEDKKRGIFLSPTRGIVAYDVTTNEFTPIRKDDERIKNTEIYPEAQVHTVFGDSYLLLTILKKTGIIDVLRDVFQKDEEYERVLCHLLHGVLKDGSHIKCDDFIEKSFASYLLENTPLRSLYSDTAYFTLMGNDDVKLAVFKTFIRYMRKHHKNFGKACYVDSTPLPNNSVNNPFNALVRHGLSSSESQMRLVLILDEATGLPVWFHIIPGNLLDLSTIINVIKDVESNLDILLESFILDAGYISKDMLSYFTAGPSKRSVIARMPARKGFPFKTLYWKIKPLIGNGKYNFIRNNHVYFGKKEAVTIFECELFAYVYIDQNNALDSLQKFLMNKSDEYKSMTNSEKSWRNISGGFFVLISTENRTPKEILDQYFLRTEVETVFKTSKDYLNLLPISKWTDTTVRGKILSDIINTIAYLQMRKLVNNTESSMAQIIGKTQSLMCTRTSNDFVSVEVPNKQSKESYEKLKVTIPPHVNLKDFKGMIFGVKSKESTPKKM